MSSIARMRAAQSARERAESPKRVSFDDGTRGGGGAATARAASPGRSASPAMSTAGMTAGSRQRAAPGALVARADGGAERTALG